MLLEVMKFHGLVRVPIAVAAAWRSVIRSAERTWGGTKNRASAGQARSARIKELAVQSGWEACTQICAMGTWSRERFQSMVRSKNRAHVSISSAGSQENQHV